VPEIRIPKGQPWMFFNNLEPQTTAEDVAEFLAACNLEIPVENIEMLVGYENRTYAVVSFPNELLAALVNWAINGNRLHGHRMDANPSKRFRTAL
jgi:hypothetical protein